MVGVLRIPEGALLHLPGLAAVVRVVHQRAVGRLQHIDIIALGGDGAPGTLRLGQIHGLGPRLAEVGAAAEDGVCAVVGGMRVSQVLGAAAEDDVDDVALKGHLGVVVEGGSVEALHIFQRAP